MGISGKDDSRTAGLWRDNTLVSTLGAYQRNKTYREAAIGTVS
jgi:hypothetical protein